VIRRQGPWRHVEAVEFATLAWVDWFNTRRLLAPIGYVPPIEFEDAYYREQHCQTTPAMGGWSHVTESPANPGRFTARPRWQFGGSWFGFGYRARL